MNEATLDLVIALLGGNLITAFVAAFEAISKR